MVNINIRLFLISMLFCTFVLLDFFVLFESSCMSFFLNFYSGSSIHSVLLCERCIDFSTHGRRRTLEILYSYGLVLLGPPSAFLSEFYSGSSIHSVLFCERRIYFSSHVRRGTFGNLRFMLLILCFDMHCFFKEF